MTTIDADVCIVGTGAGGAPVAQALAEAGAKVVMLEEGPLVDPSAMSGRPRDMIPLLYRDAGQFTTIGRPPIPLPLGRAVGGTTIVNSGTCFRTPDHVLEEWSREHGIDPDLATEYAQVERQLSVGPVHPDLAGANAHVARRAAEKLSWSGGWLNRNATGCVGSGVCAYGCPAGAKQHTALTFVERAVKAGADLRPGTRATRLLIENGRARGVEANGLTVRAGRTVVAAGAIHTPLLLAASGIRNPMLGANLSIHPCTAVWALMDEEIDMHRGVPQSYHVDEFAADGIVLEGIAGPPDYLALAVPFTGAKHREVMLRYRNVAQFGLMIRDETRGRVILNRAVRATGRAIVRYDLTPQDAARARRGVRHLVELFEAAGAREIFAPGEGKLMAFHPLGTARADARPDHGVVDPRLKVHGIESLYVADGSVVCGAPGVNPQLTIMALATRLGRHLTTAP
jgi:choline dehydrogenase-like flavoprotein